MTDADFGLRPPGAASIGDTVWIDSNENGVVDSGEAGLPGVTVKLYNSGHTLLLETVRTDANGIYTFTGLYAGDYQVEVDTSSVVTTSFGVTSTIAAAMDLVSVARQYGQPDQSPGRQRAHGQQRGHHRGLRLQLGRLHRRLCVVG